MKRRHNPPTLQTIQRADGSTYQTLNTRRLKNASPLQTVMPAQRRISRISVVLIAIIVALLALALMVGSTHAQTCQIGSAPVLTPLPASGEGLGVGTCIEPRAYLPLAQHSAVHIRSLASAGLLLSR